MGIMYLSLSEASGRNAQLSSIVSSSERISCEGWSCLVLLMRIESISSGNPAMDASGNGVVMADSWCSFVAVLFVLYDNGNDNYHSLHIYTQRGVDLLT